MTFPTTETLVVDWWLRDRSIGFGSTDFMAWMVFVRTSMDCCCFNSASRTCWRGVEAVEELHSFDLTTSDNFTGC